MASLCPSARDLAHVQPIRDSDLPAPHLPLTPPTGTDLARGRYLCEGCQDVMTDAVLEAAQSPTGIEIALCGPCQVRQGL